MLPLSETEFILYVADQNISAGFYEKLFRCKPSLHVPGMTEFVLSPYCKLGLMPNMGIAQILGNRLPAPDSGNGIPRCELYMHVEDVAFEFAHALLCGAREISAPQNRNWGDCVAYAADPDGHVLAFAQKIK